MSQDNNNCEPNCPCGQYRKGERNKKGVDFAKEKAIKAIREEK